MAARRLIFSGPFGAPLSGSLSIGDRLIIIAVVDHASCIENAIESQAIRRCDNHSLRRAAYFALLALA